MQAVKWLAEHSTRIPWRYDYNGPAAMLGNTTGTGPTGAFSEANQIPRSPVEARE